MLDIARLVQAVEHDRRHSVRGKGDKVRRVPVSARTRPALAVYLATRAHRLRAGAGAPAR